MKHQADQFELPGTEQAFNLAGETQQEIDRAILDNAPLEDLPLNDQELFALDRELERERNQ